MSGKVATPWRFAGIFMTEAHNDSLALGLHTRRITVGSAIAKIYLRHPALLASEAAVVHEFTGGRFILGLGTGHRDMIDATLLVGSEARGRERLEELTAPGVAAAIVFTNPVGEDRNGAVNRTIRAMRP